MNRRVKGVFNATETSLKAFSRSEAQHILREGHHRYQQSGFQQVATALGCSGPNLLYPHFTPSPLSSASLLASYVRNRILRNLEHVSGPVIKRTLDFASEKHPAWIHNTSQQARKLQCQQAINYLESREKMLMLKLDFDTKNKRLNADLDEVRAELKKLGLVMQFMEDSVKGNLHPSSLLQGDNVFLTPSEAAQLPSPVATVRGIRVRIKGPRRGTRCMTWQRSAGRISTNSIKYVTSEEAKLAIPSKLGIFGLTVRIVYSRRNRLVDLRSVLNVLDQPRFTFVRT